MTSHTNNTAEPANHLAERNGWRWVRLGDHVSKIGSGLTPLGGHASYQASGIPLIRSQNVHMNRFEPDGLAFISTDQDEAMAVSRVQPGDVLLNITGASIGRVCVVPAERCPANVNQHVCVIRGDDSLDSEFVAFFLASPEFQSFIWETQAGATRQALTKALIEDFRIPFTLLEKQRRIAGRLRKQLAEVAKARTAVQAQLAAAQALPAASLRDVFNSNEAQSWPRRCLGDVCELLPSKSICLTADAEVRAITTASLTETGFDPAGIKTGRMWASDVPDCTVRAGEILIARSNTPELVGRVALFKGESPGAVASDLTIRIWPGDEVHGDFLTRYLSSLYLTGYWCERAGGSSGTMKKITRSQILAEKVPVPSLDEQECVAARLAAELAEVTRLRESLSGKLETLDRLPAALLAQAFQGGR